MVIAFDILEQHFSARDPCQLLLLIPDRSGKMVKVNKLCVKQGINVKRAKVIICVSLVLLIQ